MPKGIPVSPEQLKWVVDHNMQIRGGHRVQILDSAEAWRADRKALADAIACLRALGYPENKLVADRIQSETHP